MYILDIDKQISLHGYVFLKLLTPKYVVTCMHKSSSLWKAITSLRVNDFQNLLQSAEKPFYFCFFILLTKFEWEEVIFSHIQDFRTPCKHIHSGWRVFSTWSYLKNKRYFAVFSLSFSNVDSVLNILKKNEPRSLRASEIIDSKNVVTLLRKRSCFWNPLISQRISDFQNFLKSAKKPFCTIFSSLEPKKSFSVRFKILGQPVNELTPDDKVLTSHPQLPNFSCCFSCTLCFRRIMPFVLNLPVNTSLLLRLLLFHL